MMWAKFSELCGDVWDQRDRRVDGWPLMSSPLPTALVCATYVVLVTGVGPRYMRDRKPCELRNFLFAYNAVQVVLNAFIFKNAIFLCWGVDYSFRCQPIDRSNSPKAIRIAQFCYVYYLTKFLDMVDTFCFVARKKFSQISLLHIVHHGIMPLSCWVGMRFLPGGHGTFFGLCNTAVHVFVYTYYLLAAMGPRYKKYIFWKRQLTTIQMLQFVLVFFHSVQTLFYEDCDFPDAFAYAAIGHAILFFCLFAHFYVTEYHRKQEKAHSGLKTE